MEVERFKHRQLAPTVGRIVTITRRIRRTFINKDQSTGTAWPVQVNIRTQLAELQSEAKSPSCFIRVQVGVAPDALEIEAKSSVYDSAAEKITTCTETEVEQFLSFQSSIKNRGGIEFEYQRGDVRPESVSKTISVLSNTKLVQLGGPWSRRNFHLESYVGVLVKTGLLRPCGSKIICWVSHN
jgi:hypothetical protein